MSDIGILASAGLTIVGVVALILRFKVDPVISLVLGSIILVLVNGFGARDAIDAVINGFGDILLDIGLIIGFGVLIGTLLSKMGAIQELGNLLVRTFSPTAIPYSFSTTIGTLLASLYSDVAIVITAPLAKATVPSLGKNGLPRMASAVAVGVCVALVFSVPGVASLALAGVLGVPLGVMLLAGIPIAVLTIVSTIALMNVIYRTRLWNPVRDEMAASNSIVRESRQESRDAAYAGTSGTPAPTPPSPIADDEAPDSNPTGGSKPGILIAFLPLVVSLMLISAGAFAQMADVDLKLGALFVEPTIALFLGLVGTWLVSRIYCGIERTQSAFSEGFKSTGQILLITGVGGCLAAAVDTIGMGDVLSQYFEPGGAAPLLLVWVVAAVLHIGIGSVTTSAITAAGILAPIAAALNIDPVLIALAAGAGSIFAVHVTSNTFWMIKSLFDLTVSGALKAYTLSVSIASVVALFWILILSAII